MGGKRISDTIAKSLFVGLIGLAVVFAVIPLVVSFALSFDARDYISRFPPTNFSWRWYIAFVTNSMYTDALQISLLVGVLATAAATVVGVLAAVFIERYRFPGRDVMQAIFLSPLIIPSVVTGFAVLVFTAKIGVVEGLPRLFLGHTIISVPFVIRTTLASLVGIRPSLTEAAMTLGANERQAFLHITLPLAKTGIVVGAVFAFVMSFDEVAVSMFLSDPFTMTLPLAILSETRANLTPTIAAVSVVFMVFTVLLIYVLDRFVDLDRLVGQGVYRG